MNSIYKYFSLAFLLILPHAVQGMNSQQPNITTAAVPTKNTSTPARFPVFDSDKHLVALINHGRVTCMKSEHQCVGSASLVYDINGQPIGIILIPDTCSSAQQPIFKLLALLAPVQAPETSNRSMDTNVPNTTVTNRHKNEEAALECAVTTLKQPRSGIESDGGTGCSSTTTTSVDTIFTRLPPELQGAVLEHINERTRLLSLERATRLKSVCKSWHGALRTAPYGLHLDLSHWSKNSIEHLLQQQIEKERVASIELGDVHSWSFGGSCDLVAIIQQVGNMFPNLKSLDVDLSIFPDHSISNIIDELISATENNPLMRQNAIAEKVRSIKLGSIKGGFDPLLKIIEKLEKTFPNLEFFGIELWDSGSDHNIDTLLSTTATNHSLKQKIRGITLNTRIIGRPDHKVQQLIATFTDLEKLSLNLCTKFTQKVNFDFNAIAQLHSLRELAIQCPTFDGYDLKKIIKSIPHLEKIAIINPNRLLARDFDDLAQLHDLRELEVFICPTFDGFALRTIIKSVPHLEKLGICGCRQLSTEDLGTIANLHDLRKFGADGTTIDGNTLRMIIEANKKLEVVRLTGSDQLRKEDFAVLAQLHNLKELAVSSGAIDLKIFRAIEAANPEIFICMS